MSAPFRVRLRVKGMPRVGMLNDGHSTPSISFGALGRGYGEHHGVNHALQVQERLRREPQSGDSARVQSGFAATGVNWRPERSAQGQDASACLDIRISDLIEKHQGDIAAAVGESFAGWLVRMSRRSRGLHHADSSHVPASAIGNQDAAQ